MNKCREAFEKLPEIEPHLAHGNVFFDKEKQTYASEFSALYVVACYVNGAWMAWQSRQAEIDLISANHNGQMIGHDVFVKQLKERHGKQVQGLANAISKFEKEMDEKDKRIAKALVKWNSIVSILTTMDMVIVPDKVFEKLDELEKALRGERE